MRGMVANPTPVPHTFVMNLNWDYSHINPEKGLCMHTFVCPQNLIHTIAEPTWN